MYDDSLRRWLLALARPKYQLLELATRAGNKATLPRDCKAGDSPSVGEGGNTTPTRGKGPQLDRLLESPTEQHTARQSYRVHRVVQKGVDANVCAASMLKSAQALKACE